MQVWCFHNVLNASKAVKADRIITRKCLKLDIPSFFSIAFTITWRKDISCQQHPLQIASASFFCCEGSFSYDWRNRNTNLKTKWRCFTLQGLHRPGGDRQCKGTLLGHKHLCGAERDSRTAWELLIVTLIQDKRSQCDIHKMPWVSMHIRLRG